MSQVNYQATYKYFIVYMLEIVPWIRAGPDVKQQIKGMAFDQTFSIIIADDISLKAKDTQQPCHPWREYGWRYAHNFLLFQFSDVLYLCNNSLGLAEVRLHKRNGNVTDEQKTEQLQTQLLFFPPVSQQFYLSHWISKKE